MKLDFTDLEKELYALLVEKETTRSNDMYLYSCYLVTHEVNLLLAFGINGKEVLRENKIAPYATVERARRKLQADYPHLRKQSTYENRINEEENYIKYGLDYDSTQFNV